MVLGLRGPCSATSGGGVLIVAGEFCPSLREIGCECSGVTVYKNEGMIKENATRKNDDIKWKVVPTYGIIGSFFP